MDDPFCLHPDINALPALFTDPPLTCHPWTNYALNGKIDRQVMAEHIRAMRARCGYGGFGPWTFPNLSEPAYLSDDYADLFRDMLSLAREHGMQMLIYDEGFPTGSLGGKFALRFPELVMHRLDIVEHRVSAGAVELPVPTGALMAAVALEMGSGQRVDLQPFIVGWPHAGQQRALRWRAPAGDWRVMFFVCVADGVLLDYLNPEAVRAYMAMSYAPLAGQFSPAFGETIPLLFFDDIALVYTRNGRAWTSSFNPAYSRKNTASLRSCSIPRYGTELGRTPGPATCSLRVSRRVAGGQLCRHLCTPGARRATAHHRPLGGIIS